METRIFPKVSIAYLSFRRWEYVTQTLPALINGTLYPDREIIVVDQGGDADVRDFLVSLLDAGHIDKLILNQRNLGCGYASNEALRLCEGDYLAYVQNDMLLARPDTAVSILGPGGIPAKDAFNWIEESIFLFERLQSAIPFYPENHGRRLGVVSHIAEDIRTCPIAHAVMCDGYAYLEKSSKMQTSYNDHPYVMSRSIRKDIGEYSYGGHGPLIEMGGPHNEGDYQRRFLSKGYYAVKTIHPRFQNIGRVSVFENPDGSVFSKECLAGWGMDGKEIRDKFDWIRPPSGVLDQFVRHGEAGCKSDISGS